MAMFNNSRTPSRHQSRHSLSLSSHFIFFKLSEKLAPPRHLIGPAIRLAGKKQNKTKLAAFQLFDWPSILIGWRKTKLKKTRGRRAIWLAQPFDWLEKTTAAAAQIFDWPRQFIGWEKNNKKLAASSLWLAEKTKNKKQREAGALLQSYSLFLLAAVNRHKKT